MDTHFLEPLTEDEMYTIEFHDCELHEDEPEEEAENGYHCPVCHATELQYAMHYRVSDDDETQELYQCARCGATGEADDCRVEPDHSNYQTIVDMLDDKVEGYFLLGQNPAVGSANGKMQ